MCFLGSLIVVMFKKTIIILIVTIASFSFGHYLGYRDGFTTQATESLTKASRYQSTTQMAFSFVPLRSVLDGDTDNAVYVLTNTLSAGIMGLTDTYDSKDIKSAEEIVSIINTITDWRETNDFTYENSSVLKEAIDEFNNKHNKPSNLTGEKDSPSS